jgi:hypothetical protein
MSDETKKEPPDNDSFWKILAVIGLMIDLLGVLVALIK